MLPLHVGDAGKELSELGVAGALGVLGILVDAKLLLPLEVLDEGGFLLCEYHVFLRLYEIPLRVRGVWTGEMEIIQNAKYKMQNAKSRARARRNHTALTEIFRGRQILFVCPRTEPYRKTGFRLRERPHSFCVLIFAFKILTLLTKWSII
jgi:hypothetical protein